MAEVLKFKRKEKLIDPIAQWSRDVVIWVCTCGCEVFYLHENGEVECQDCALISNAMVCGEK